MFLCHPQEVIQQIKIHQLPVIRNICKNTDKISKYILKELLKENTECMS
jgi:hypothetical protein